MKPPVKPDNIPNPPEGFIYAGYPDTITGLPLKRQSSDLAVINPEQIDDKWETKCLGSGSDLAYAIRTDSPIHKAQPWYNHEAFERMAELIRLNPVLNRLAFFTDEDLEAELERRHKPKTITINEIEVPEPRREELKNGISYWYVNFTCENLVERDMWSEHRIDNQLLKNGFIHLTKEAAIKHAEALISFTKLP